MSKIKFFLQKDKHYVFLDTEFNTTGNKEQDTLLGINKILSIGLIITDYKFNELAKYYSCVKPKNFKEVYKACTDLTHLTTEKINHSKSFNEVIKEIHNLLENYNIENIFVYSNSDKRVINNDFDLNNTPKEHQKYFKEIKDIQPILNSILPYYKTNLWGLKQVCKYFNIKNNELHNSLEDAIMLKKCLEKYCSSFRNSYYYNKLKKVVENKKKREN